MKRACLLLAAFFALAVVTTGKADVVVLDEHQSFTSTGPAGLFGPPLIQDSVTGEVGRLALAAEATEEEEDNVFAPVPLPLPLTMLALSIAGLLAYRSLPSA